MWTAAGSLSVCDLSARLHFASASVDVVVNLKRFLSSDKKNYKQLLGTMDYSFLCAYAVGMYLR